MAVLGLAKGENLMLRPDGGWAAQYVPAVMRAYPLGRLLNQLRLVLRAPPFGLVMEIAQRLFAHVLAPAAHVGQHARRIAHDVIAAGELSPNPISSRRRRLPPALQNNGSRSVSSPRSPTRSAGTRVDAAVGSRERLPRSRRAPR